MDDFFAIIAQPTSLAAFNDAIEQLSVTNNHEVPSFSAPIYSQSNRNVLVHLSYVSHNEKIHAYSKKVLKEALPVVGTTRIDNCETLKDSVDLNLPNNLAHFVNTFESGGVESCTDGDSQRYMQQRFEHALILNTFTRANTQCAQQLNGCFNFVLWDEDSQTAYAAIDPFSGNALFYLALDGLLIIASNARILSQYKSLKLTLNELSLAQWLCGRPSPAASMFNEIKRLPNGHFLAASFSANSSDSSFADHSINNAVKVGKFWDIDHSVAIRHKNVDEYSAHFNDILTRSVKKALSAELGSEEPKTVFAQMSGGMDSTSVTALANELTANSNVSLHSISHSYRNTNSCDESDNINDMIEFLALEHHHFVELDKYADINFNQLYPTDFDSPGIVYSPKYEEELKLLKHFNAKTLLTGNGGDETCWGHSATYRSRLLRGDVSVVTEVAKACKTLEQPVLRSLYQVFVSPFIPEQLMQLQRMLRGVPYHPEQQSPWLTDKATELMNSLVFDNPYSKRFEPAKHARYDSIHNTSTYNSMRSYQKIANRFDINVYHPFFDPELVNFSFAIPEGLLIKGAYPKWLLRTAMTNKLPESVCWNAQKTVFDHHFANLVRSNAKELRQLLSHRGLHAMGLIDNKVLLAEFDAVVENKKQNLHVDMLYAILTQSWFQTHFYQGNDA